MEKGFQSRDLSSKMEMRWRLHHRYRLMGLMIMVRARAIELVIEIIVICVVNYWISDWEIIGWVLRWRIISATVTKVIVVVFVLSLYNGFAVVGDFWMWIRIGYKSEFSRDGTVKWRCMLDGFVVCLGTVKWRCWDAGVGWMSLLWVCIEKSGILILIYKEIEMAKSGVGTELRRRRCWFVVKS